MPGVVVGVLSLLSFLLLARFCILSDFRYLAVTRIQDDSFYYLQPAWMFKETGHFTFDGQTPTYGFQPLWMLLLAGLSYFTADKVTFVRASLVLGAFFYCATGFLLYRLSRRWTAGWRTLIAPALWLINPALISIYTTGKENALYAFLLVAVILCTYRMLERTNRAVAHVLYGGLCGLLILSRVNSLVAAALLILATFIFTHAREQRERRLQIVLTMVGLGVVLLPWIAYSGMALGSIFPNSGTQKLIGAKAALMLYLSQLLPFLPLKWLTVFLSPDERLFLQAPDQLALPSISSALSYLLLYIPRISIGSWVDKMIASLRQSRLDLLLLPYTIVFFGLIASFSYGLFVQIRKLKSRSTMVITTLRSHIPVVILFLFALINASANSLLLPNHIYYATWYAVPETLSCVLLAAYAGTLAFGPTLPARTRYIVAIAALVLVSSPISSLYRDLSPQPYRREGASLPEVWEAHFWIDQHLPVGARIGAMSSGLLGYVTDDRVVVNLDGLANSPDYVTTVWRQHMLYSRGLAPHDALWDYIRAKGIQYLANPEWDATLGKQPFLGTVPVDNYDIVYRGSNLIDWGEAEGPRRFVIVRLRY